MVYMIVRRGLKIIYHDIQSEIILATMAYNYGMLLSPEVYILEKP